MTYLGEILKQKLNKIYIYLLKSSNLEIFYLHPKMILKIKSNVILKL